MNKFAGIFLVLLFHQFALGQECPPDVACISSPLPPLQDLILTTDLAFLENHRKQSQAEAAYKKTFEKIRKIIKQRQRPDLDIDGEFEQRKRQWGASNKRQWQKSLDPYDILDQYVNQGYFGTGCFRLYYALVKLADATRQPAWKEYRELLGENDIAKLRNWREKAYQNARSILDRMETDETPACIAYLSNISREKQDFENNIPPPEGRPDLIVQNIWSVPASRVIEGMEVEFRFEVANRGEGRVRRAFGAEFSIPGVRSIYHTFQPLALNEVDESLVVRHTFTEPGDYEVSLVLDGDINLIDEINEENNTKTILFSVEAATIAEEKRKKKKLARGRRSPPSPGALYRTRPQTGIHP